MGFFFFFFFFWGGGGGVKKLPLMVTYLKFQMLRIMIRNHLCNNNLILLIYLADKFRRKHCLLCTLKKNQ